VPRLFTPITATTTLFEGAFFPNTGKFKTVRPAVASEVFLIKFLRSILATFFEKNFFMIPAAVFNSVLFVFSKVSLNAAIIILLRAATFHSIVPCVAIPSSDVHA
jgi:hypothetical protein